MTAPQLITNATTNVTGMYTIFQYVGEVAPFFFSGILFAILIILFVIFKSSSPYSNARPFTVACFFTMVLSILFRVMDFIGNRWMYVFITAMAIGLVWLHLENSQV